LHADERVRFTVKAVRVSGNAAFDEATLRALVSGDLLGKRASLADLQSAAGKITAYYRAHGFLVARAYVPAQKIDEARATVEIAVIEGVLGKLTVSNQSRLSEATVARFTTPMHPGAPVTEATLGRQILLLSDQAGVPSAGGIDAVLRAGRETGQSDVDLDIGHMPLLTGQVGVDNYGSRYTGATRTTGQVNLLSPFGLGDSFTFNYLDSFDGLRSGAFAAAVPIGGDGLSVGATYVDASYRLGGDFASLQASGTAHSTGVYVAYPWVRTERWNFSTSLGADHHWFVDRLDSTNTVTPKHVDVMNLTLNGDLRDTLTPNSVFSWRAVLESGHVGIDTPDAGATAARTEGHFRKFNASLLYLQALSRDWTVYGSLVAQRSSRNLDSSEQLTLGGPYAVRAYPVGAAAGDEGEVGTIELRHSLPQMRGLAPSLVIFADRGLLRINHSPFAPGTNSIALGTAGLGFTVAKAGSFSAQLYWSVKNTSSSAVSDVGRSNRVWGQVAMYF
jgi:hemolysin activation/secretion protein